MSNAQITNLSILVFCIFINVIILFFVLINETGKDKRSKVFIGILSVNFVLLFSYMIRQYFEGNPDPAYNPLLIWTASLYQATSQVLLLFHIRITLLLIERHAIVTRFTKYAAYAAAAVVSLNLLLSASTPFTHLYFYFDEMNLTALQDAIIISDISIFIWTALTITILLVNRKNLTKKEMGALLSYVVLPTIALTLYLITTNLQFIIYSISLSTVIYFAGIQSDLSRQLKQKELELTESKVSIMLSQIKPHFLYNALSTIAQLCDDNPAEAKKATLDFSKYLRKNMESLNDNNLITVENELNHVESYLNLEKAMHGDSLNVRYNIEAGDFLLPPLTIQPIVENAVKHGIGKREDGGTVTVTIGETTSAFIISVSDDGVGYDPGESNPADRKSAGDRSPDDRSSIGINNVKRRLKEQCGGTLEITGEPGKGTTAIIKVPKTGN